MQVELKQWWDLVSNVGHLRPSQCPVVVTHPVIPPPSPAPASPASPNPSGLPEVPPDL